MKIALLYDFDKTLSDRDMQEYGFIEDLGIQDPGQFWGLVDHRSKANQMDHILAYLFEMVHQSNRAGKPLTKAHLQQYASRVQFYPGVEAWFELINHYGATLGYEIEHYIVSSGLKEIIEATPIAKYFKKVFACEYYYDEQGHAIWPKLTVNYTMKTQFIYRINKGVLDVANDEDLNKHQADEDKPVPFTHMIYIGDGLTDVPSMKLVKSSGGHSIAVYPPGKGVQAVTRDLLGYNRVDFVAKADYSERSRLHHLITTIINTLHSQDQLAAMPKGENL